jgi:hypothetical protein
VSRWKDIINIDLKDVRREGLEDIHTVQDNVQWRFLMNTIMYFRIP